MKAQDIVLAAMRKLRVAKAGFSPSDAEMRDGLENLNTMLKSWSADALFIPFRTKETLTLTAGVNPHTIGTGGTLNTVAPMQINTAVIRVGDHDYELDNRTAERYAKDVLKNVQARPEWFYYERGQNATVALGKLYFEYVPDTNYTLILDSYKPFTPLATLTSDNEFPDIYERPLIFGLAVDMAPEWGKEPSPTVVRIANASKMEVMALNFSERVPIMNIDRSLRPRRRFDINVIY